ANPDAPCVGKSLMAGGGESGWGGAGSDTRNHRTPKTLCAEICDSVFFFLEGFGGGRRPRVAFCAGRGVFCLTNNNEATLPWPMQLAVPGAALVTFGIHFLISRSAPPPETHSYMLLFWEIVGVSIVLGIAQRFWPALRQWMRHMWPIFTAAILSLGVWDVITTGLHLLPLPYFPGPAAVLRSLISDRGLLLDSTCHSLVLLLSGYAVGVIVGLVSGVCIGWSTSVRYWGMPLLKVVGPIPATA